MAGVSEPNDGQMAQAIPTNPAPPVGPAAPSPEAGPAASASGGLPGGLQEAILAIRERQDRDYHRYVKAFRDYHEHAETYRDWMVGGVRIRARDTACPQCTDAGTKIYDADTLPRLPLAGCPGDGDGYCSCTYVVALRRASAAAPAMEVALPAPAPTVAPTTVQGLCSSCGGVLAAGATACRVCGTPNPAAIAMSLTPERPSTPRPGVSDSPLGRNRWLRNLLGGRGAPASPDAQPQPEGVPVGPGAEALGALGAQDPVAGRSRRRRLPPLLRPLQRAGYRLTRRWHQRTVTLSLDAGTTRVVVFRGRDVIAWGATRPDEELGLAEQDPAGSEERNRAALLELLDQLHVRRQRTKQGTATLAGRLKSYLGTFGASRSRVVTDLPLYDTLVRHLQLPRVAQNYLEPMIVSEVLDSIPFGRNEVDIAWHTQRRGSKQSVFAVATPKDRLDRRMVLLRGAGIPPMAGYSRAEALAFAAGVSDVILVHLESSHASVVLVHDNMPQVVHQVVLVRGDDSVQARAEILARAVDQVSGYYHVSGAGVESIAWPVVLTGRFTEPLEAALQRLSRRRALPFSQGVDWPDGFRPEDYAPNLGLFLAYEARSRDRSSKVVRHPWVPLNLLAERHMPKVVPVTPAAVFITLLLLWFHPFDVGGHVDAKQLATGALSVQVERLKATAQGHRATQAEEKATQKETIEINQRRQILQLELDDAEANMETLLVRLDTTTNLALPAGVRLTSVIQRGDGFTLVGTAYSYDQVLAYTANLRGSGLFSGARVLKVDGREDVEDRTKGSVSFQVEATVAAIESAPKF